MLKYWIWLSTREGVSNVQALSLLSRLGSAAAIYQADEDALKDADGRSVPASLLDKSLTGAEIILQQCYQKNIHVMTIQDAQYPARLRVISDPPIVLYYKGVFPAIDTSPVIAMVGTRKASAYGLMQAKRLGYQVAKSGGIVVSGGADGIDTMCLTGALTADRPVIAVLGCGVDVVYPAGNRVLFEDIAAHGCLLSEYPPQTPALGSHFPVRNRIISALSLGVVVVEAPKRSGALITANRALEQGRDVFTVPGNVGTATCEGNIQLLREGAIVVEDGWDIMKEYVHFVSGARVPSAENHPHAADPGQRESAVKSTDKLPPRPKKTQKKKLRPCPPTQKSLTSRKTGLILTYRKFWAHYRPTKRPPSASSRAEKSTSIRSLPQPGFPPRALPLR
ncbi:MAG: DNA-processing protein DprA [Oscillospiraceae bacterium]